jgi:NAD-dependent dihydropyrimidine dehydrogenase PreA subunit
MASKMDPNKRKFLKHLGLLGFGALIGLGITHATSPSANEIINNYSNAEIKSGRKLIWETKVERDDDLDRNTPIREVREGGLPFVNESVCAYHIDDNGDGNYEKSEEVRYCTMPCKDICPVDAITKHENSDGTFLGKVVPKVNEEKCIGCTKCFRICGYNAIEWINHP